ncbi:MAG: ribosomal RNA small subunit methyltransferase A [Elusimicrobia bacterium]|nr:ribosomal RNA small subunit methyltransferase A [Elusimicrobiota bacterium]
MTRARLDQHFLVDPSVADRIVREVGAKAGDTVVEIGPGRGILTERLVEAGVRLTAVEIDENLHAILAGRFAETPNLALVRSDFLELDLSTLPKPARIVSNLPYSMGTTILQKFLPWEGWTEAVLMFQKEVADRVQAPAGSRDYGVLSLSVAVYADAGPLFDVGRFAFRPPPQVQSAVVKLIRRDKPRLPPGLSEKAFFRVVKAAFAQRRKMAANSIAASLGLEREDVAKALEACGLHASARGETIDLDGFCRLALALKA